MNPQPVSLADELRKLVEQVDRALDASIKNYEHLNGEAARKCAISARETLKELSALLRQPAVAEPPFCGCEEDRCYGPITGYRCRYAIAEPPAHAAEQPKLTEEQAQRIAEIKEREETHLKFTESKLSADVLWLISLLTSPVAPPQVAVSTGAPAGVAPPPWTKPALDEGAFHRAQLAESFVPDYDPPVQERAGERLELTGDEKEEIFRYQPLDLHKGLLLQAVMRIKATAARQAREEFEKEQWEPWTWDDGAPLTCSICGNEIPRCERGYMGDEGRKTVQHMDCGYQQIIKETWGRAMLLASQHKYSHGRNGCQCSCGLFLEGRSDVAWAEHIRALAAQTAPQKKEE